MESILIYVAALLKKKIVVYHPKLTTLHHICRLVWRLKYKPSQPIVDIDLDYLIVEVILHNLFFKSCGKQFFSKFIK